LDIRQNIPLAPYTTFGIGGPARWFAEAQSENDIVEATDWARQHSLPLFVLGGGSNLLVADSGFDGLVLHIALRGIDARLEGAEQGILISAAGVDWEVCVQRSLDLGWAGLECLSGIPGTVGGTPVQNVGAYGQEVASVISRVRAFNIADRAFVDLSADECGFSYRRSRFNTSDYGRFIVTQVEYRLTPGGAPTLRYADLERVVEAAHATGSAPTLAEIAAIVRRIRQLKGMLLVDGDPDCRSAGSFFKNPVISEEHYERIAARSVQAPPRYPAGAGEENRGRVKVPAAWLIEHSGFGKGFAAGPAGISSRHTLALINRGGATAHAILNLASEISAAVEDRYSIRLEREPVMVGFDGIV
jgi:UDP-N-acetylmuramate dehydrogenase